MVQFFDLVVVLDGHRYECQCEQSGDDGYEEIAQDRVLLHWAEQNIRMDAQEYACYHRNKQ